MKHWTDGSGRLELSVSMDEARMAAHRGECGDDVLALSNVPHVLAQLERMDRHAVRRHLVETGGWTRDEIDDHEQNLQRVLWLACWDVIENESEVTT